MTSRRSNLIIIVFVAVSVLGTVFALFFGEKFSTYESFRNDVYSYSALGHRAFHENLEDKYPRVEISQQTSHSYDYLFLIEPDTKGQEDELQEMLEKCATCILVLPKRKGFADKEGKHISKFKLNEVKEIESLLDRYLGYKEELRFERVPSINPKYNHIPLEAPKIEGPIQVVGGIDPKFIIYGSEEGALIFYQEIDDTTRMVISDPDLLANHGFDEDENYRFMSAFLEDEFGAFRKQFDRSPSIGIDETMHGYRRAPSLLRLLTSFPLSIFTIQLLLILLFVTWRGLIRFGKPTYKAGAIDLGVETLIDNTASLFSPNHAVYLGKRYVMAALSDVAESLNAPRQFTHNELVNWLDEETAARGFSFRISEVLEKIADFEVGIEQWKAKEIVTMAQQVDQWRNRMRNE